MADELAKKKRSYIFDKGHFFNYQFDECSGVSNIFPLYNQVREHKVRLA